jgi:hypothetical protein
MPRPKNPARGVKFEVTLAAQSVTILQQLATRGIYGRTAAEVGGRFIEHALKEFVEPPKFNPASHSRGKQI